MKECWLQLLLIAFLMLEFRTVSARPRQIYRLIDSENNKTVVLDNAHEAGPARERDREEVDVKEKRTKHARPALTIAISACPNTILPHGSDLYKMVTEYDETTGLPKPSFCGCNPNEYLEEIPRNLYQPETRICRPCPEGEYMDKYAHKERQCKPR